MQISRILQVNKKVDSLQLVMTKLCEFINCYFCISLLWYLLSSLLMKILQIFYIFFAFKKNRVNKPNRQKCYLFWKSFIFSSTMFRTFLLCFSTRKIRNSNHNLFYDNICFIIIHSSHFLKVFPQEVECVEDLLFSWLLRWATQPRTENMSILYVLWIYPMFSHFLLSV